MSNNVMALLQVILSRTLNSAKGNVMSLLQQAMESAEANPGDAGQVLVSNGDGTYDWTNALLASNNLSDLDDVSTARTNLGVNASTELTDIAKLTGWTSEALNRAVSGLDITVVSGTMTVSSGVVMIKGKLYSTAGMAKTFSSGTLWTTAAGGSGRLQLTADTIAANDPLYLWAIVDPTIGTVNFGYSSTLSPSYFPIGYEKALIGVGLAAGAATALSGKVQAVAREFVIDQPTDAGLSFSGTTREVKTLAAPPNLEIIIGGYIDTDGSGPPSHTWIRETWRTDAAAAAGNHDFSMAASDDRQSVYKRVWTDSSKQIAVRTDAAPVIALQIQGWRW